MHVKDFTSGRFDRPDMSNARQVLEFFEEIGNSCELKVAVAQFEDGMAVITFSYFNAMDYSETREHKDFLIEALAEIGRSYEGAVWKGGGFVKMEAGRFEITPFISTSIGVKLTEEAGLLVIKALEEMEPASE